MSKRKDPKKPVTNTREDRCVIYYSEDNGCWIAHGLHTDQIGTGRGVLRALVELMTVVDSLFKLADERGDIEVWREAPVEIKEKAKISKSLPPVWYGIAHMVARGKWPEPGYRFSSRKFYSVDLLPAKA